ncbi:MAG: DUF951 domain-containing protein [Oscillospiraceae bacterium]|nr:DUF951 domain-containing protein [Oscillospiraceae bacterium]
MDLKLHDKVELKHQHPCGSKTWEVLRVGMDIKLRCLGCGHEVMVPRRKAEKAIRAVLSNEEGTK